jgi:hypothetical protein
MCKVLCADFRFEKFTCSRIPSRTRLAKLSTYFFFVKEDLEKAIDGDHNTDKKQYRHIRSFNIASNISISFDQKLKVDTVRII